VRRSRAVRSHWSGPGIRVVAGVLAASANSSPRDSAAFSSIGVSAAVAAERSGGVIAGTSLGERSGGATLRPGVIRVMIKARMSAINSAVSAATFLGPSVDVMSDLCRPFDPHHSSIRVLFRSIVTHSYLATIASFFLLTCHST
jgi:hypothetical protein